MKKESTAKVMMTAAMIIFGTLAPFVRRIGVSSGELALCRSLMAAVTVGAFLLFTRQRVPLSNVKKELGLLALSGAAMGFNWILLFTAYEYTTVSAATLSYYFAPVIVTAVSPLLFKERLTKGKIICFILSTLGLVMITGATGSGEGDLKGIAFGLGAATLYATVMVLNKLIRSVSGIQRTLVQFISAAVVLAPYVMLTGGCTLSGLDCIGLGALLIVGLVHTGVTYCMYFSALKELPGQEAAMLSYVDPLVAVLVSVLWLGEVLTLPQAVGGVLILGSTLLCEIKFRKSNTR